MSWDGAPGVDNDTVVVCVDVAHPIWVGANVDDVGSNLTATGEEGSRCDDDFGEQPRDTHVFRALVCVAHNGKPRAAEGRLLFVCHFGRVSGIDVVEVHKLPSLPIHTVHPIGACLIWAYTPRNLFC